MTGSTDLYVCGGYPTEHPYEQAEVLTDVNDKNSDLIVQLLTHSYNPRDGATEDDEDVFNMAAGDFAACLDVDAIEKGGLAGVPDMIAQVQELFPIEDYKSNRTLTDTDYEKYADAIAYLNSVGTAVFGDFGTSVDVLNPDSMIPSYGFITNFGDKVLSPTFDISSIASWNITKVLDRIHLVLPRAVEQGAARQLASSLLSFSAKLAQAYANVDPTVLDYAKDLYYTTTIEEATKAAPALGLLPVIKKRAPEGYEIDRIQIQLPEVWSNVSAVISQTSAATVQAAIIFSTYGNYEQYINGSLVNPTADRTKECSRYLDRSLAWISSKLFVEQKYSDEDRAAVTTVMNNLVTSFGERVKKSMDWMDEETTKLVLEKLDKMTLRIGYPDETPDVLNATSLKAYYDGVNITSSHFSNVLSIRAWFSATQWAALSGPLDENTWPNFGVHSWVANARQWRERNTALVPAGISQAPLFDRRAPAYLSYGSAGYIAAHEVTHGFDSLGRHFDQDTRLRDWWSAASADAFDNKTRCFVDQFSAVPVIGWDGTEATRKDLEPVAGGAAKGKRAEEGSNDDGNSNDDDDEDEVVYISGGRTLAENIADTGGLVTSYDAWKRLDDRDPQQGLPGLEGFTRDQLFFVAFGQTWCARYDAAFVAQVAAFDDHAPGFARTRVTAQNSRAFREAFGCEKKEPTCELW